MTRITLIHATPLAVDPIRASFARLWPEAALHSVLDDGLTAALQTAPHTIRARFEALAAYARLAEADAALFTCSAFGAAIDAARRAQPTLPMLKPNEAMFDDALRSGAVIALLASFAPAIAPMAEEFAAAAAASGRAAKLIAVEVPGAMEALNAGRADEHDRLIAEAAAALPPHDAVMLAQFSMARAAAVTARRTAAPVFTSPDSAVLRLRRMVG
jgi:hypothetical protein